MAAASYSYDLRYTEYQLKDWDELGYFIIYGRAYPKSLSEWKMKKDLISDNVIGIDEAIQKLPPELSEIIYKEYIAIKQKEREALGWKNVHSEILEKPFCEYRMHIVSAIQCKYSTRCPYQYCCYPCLNDVKRSCHEVKVISTMEKMTYKTSGCNYCNPYLRRCNYCYYRKTPSPYDTWAKRNIVGY